MSHFRIEHVGVWVEDLEGLRGFYVRYFDAVAGARYHNPAKAFTSYFLRFAGGARLELMHRPGLAEHGGERRGLAHFAFAVGTEADVDALTARLRADGHPVVDGPRRTGDGYYESVVLDPEGNRVEITT